MKGMTPITEGIKYTGSKKKMLPYILDAVSTLPVLSVLDAFSGTTRVAQAFAQMGYDTTANDVSEWTEVFANCFLVANRPAAFYKELIDELNALPGYKGWFSEHYGGEGDSGKRPFQLHNTMKLDAIREKIDSYSLDFPDKCVLLTSLIYALDSVDNTLGHYCAYLKGWSPRSYATMKLRVPQKFNITTQNRVLRGDVFDAIKDYHDLAYLDPPYGSNNEKMPPSRVRYASYYHIWKTVILNDRPTLFGKANRREDSRDTVSASVFEEYHKSESGRFMAMEAIERLVKETNAHYLLLSYGSGGRATKSELNDILNSNGKLLKAIEVDYKKNVMANMCWTNEWITNQDKYKEYLFLIEK